jgi:hypothetical protein
MDGSVKDKGWLAAMLTHIAFSRHDNVLQDLGRNYFLDKLATEWITYFPLDKCLRSLSYSKTRHFSRAPCIAHVSRSIIHSPFAVFGQDVSPSSGTVPKPRTA